MIDQQIIIINHHSMQAEIWAQLKSFSLDKPNVEYKFSDRLAQENNWTKEFSLLAIEEYKKFMFLSACAGHDVTPSKIIDKVWHLHLIYTRSYWEEMCGKILGKRIHHNPTEGGNEEDSKYPNQYKQTLNSYRKFFDTAPPVNIWGGQNNSIEPKKTFSTKKVLVCFSPLLFLLFLDSMSPFLILLLLAVFCIFIIMIIGGIADYRHDKRKEKEREEERNRYRTTHSSFSKPLSSMASNPNRGKDKGMDSNKKSNDSNDSSINPLIFPASTCSSSDNTSSNSSHSSDSSSHGSSDSSGHSSSCSSSSCGGGGCGGGGE